MFKRLRTLKIPFLPKKITAIPIEDIIAGVEEEVKNYTLIQDNQDLRELFKNKFIAKNGTQVPPREFIETIIAHIENTPPQSREAFAVFVHKMLETIPEPVTKKKRWFRKK
jgi:hypothetical protein